MSVTLCRVIWTALVVSAFVSNAAAQSKPIITNRSSSAVTVTDARIRGALNLGIPIVNDTSIGLNGGLDSLGWLIQIRATGKIWKRDTVSTGGHKWSNVETDTTSINNRILVKIDSTIRRNDSIFNCRQGVCVFAYKDSAGGGGLSGGNNGAGFRVYLPGPSAVRTLYPSPRMKMDTTTNSGITVDINPDSIPTGKVVTDSLNNRLVHVDTNSIRLRAPAYANQHIYVENGAASGIFQYISSDVSSTDDGAMVFVSGSYRWKRVITGENVNVIWFFPAGVISGDNYANIQRAINYIIATASAPRNLYFPPGGYLISKPLVIAKLSGSTYSQVTVNLIGCANSKNQPGATVAQISCLFNNTFAVGIQQGKGIAIRNLKFIGQFSFPLTLSNISVDTLTFDQWTDGSARQNTLSPYAGIAIDPFSDSTVYPNNSDMYPGMHAYCPAAMSRAGSTDITIANCNITQFIVAIIVTGSNQQNGDEVNIDDCNIGGNKVGISMCQAQSKDCHVRRFMAWSPVHTIFDNSVFGFRHGDGGGMFNIEGGNIASQIHQLGSMWAPAFRAEVRSVYAEGLFKLGSWIGPAGFLFQNCDLNLATTSSNLPYPDVILFSDNVEMRNCQIRFYGDVPTRMIFSGNGAKFAGGTLNHPPFVSLVSCCNSALTPSFDNVKLFYGGTGVLGRNRPFNPFNTNGVLNGLMSGVLTGTDPVYPMTLSSDFYKFTYTGSYDRIVPLGTKAITTNRTTWAGYFVSTAGDSTKLRVGDFLVTNNAKPIGQFSSVATASMPVGFISKISNDTVYFNNLAIEIKDSAYTIWSTYVMNNNDAFTGSVASGQKYITKVKTANGVGLSSFFSIGSRFDLPQFTFGTYVTATGNDTVYLSNASNATHAEYTWMNGYPDVEHWGTLTPEAVTQTTQKPPLYGGSIYHKVDATCCGFGYAYHYGSSYKSYKIINSNFFGDTVVHKVKYSPIVEDVGGMSLAKGTTAQIFNQNYTTPLLRINTDSVDNGFAHLTVTDGASTRQVAYKSDVSITDTSSPTGLSTRANVNRVTDSMSKTVVANLGGAKGILKGAYLSRPVASNCQCFYWSEDSVFYSYDNGTWNDLRSGSGGGSNSFLNIQANTLGTTQDPAKGILLNNVTAAAVGAQQISPALVFEGQGWKTNSTAASQSVKFKMDILPVQGAVSPTAQYKIGSSINGAAYGDRIIVNSDALASTFSSGGLSIPSGGLNFSGGGVVAQSFTSGGPWIFNISSALAGGASGWSFSHATSVFTSGTSNNVNIGSTFNPPSGTGVYNGLSIQHTINQTGGANGITRGLYINPTLTSAADYRAIEVVAGKSILAPATTARTSLNIPSGTAPSSPNHGDIWTTASHLYAYLAGNTYQIDQQGGSGITTLNTLTGSTQTFATGTSGTDFNISSSSTTHTFNMPDANGGTVRGVVSTGNQSFGGIKTFLNNIIAVMYSSSSTPAGNSAGSGAGTSPTVSLSGSDQDGLITLTTGTSPATSSDIISITTNVNPPTSGPCVTLTPGNAAAAALFGTSGIYVTSAAPYTFKLVSGSVALAASTQYKWYYHMGGN